MLNDRAQELFKLVGEKVAEVKRLDKENPTGPDEETDPRIVALLAEMDEHIKELDPLVRKAYRYRPEAILEWDEIMHMNDDLKKKEDADASIDEPLASEAES
ncbi:MAG: hypothetical protein QOF02_3934 [Blastocatellia bacterium]|jgi:hypothetical protein|nr:hypothetical protein [Blastocatellia bacterium]